MGRPGKCILGNAVVVILAHAGEFALLLIIGARGSSACWRTWGRWFCHRVLSMALALLIQWTGSVAGFPTLAPPAIAG